MPRTVSANAPQPAEPWCPEAETSAWGNHHEWTWRRQPSRGRPNQQWTCHWRVLGPSHGPALVLLHGFGASSGHWRRIAPKLAAQGWQVFSLDLLGFGASDQPGIRQSGPLDNRIWGQQTAAFLQEIVQRPAVLVGNSLGGLSALTTAVLTPHLVRALVAAPLPDPALLQPLPRRRSPWRRRWIRRWLGLVVQLIPLQWIVPVIARSKLIRLGLQGAYTASITNDLDLQQLIGRPARRPTAARALRAMTLGMSLRPRGATAPALLEQLATTNLPMLLLWGQNDRFIPLTIGQQVVHQHPWVELNVLHHCGHCPHDEDPIQFLNALLPWLDRNLGNSRPAGDVQQT